MKFEIGQRVVYHKGIKQAECTAVIVGEYSDIGLWPIVLDAGSKFPRYKNMETKAPWTCPDHVLSPLENLYTSTSNDQEVFDTMRRNPTTQVLDLPSMLTIAIFDHKYRAEATQIADGGDPSRVLEIMRTKTKKAEYAAVQAYVKELNLR